MPIFRCWYGSKYEFRMGKKIGAANTNENGVALVLDANKFVIVTGNFQGTVDFDAGPGVSNLTSKGGNDIYITKYDTSGNFIWAKQIGGTIDDIANNIKIDKAGNLIVTGLFQGTVDMDPGAGVFNLTSVGSNNFVLKLDNNGNFIWAKQVFAVSVKTLATDGADNVLVGGAFSGTQDFDPGPGTFMATANTPNFDDMFVLKLNSAGNFVWFRQVRNLGTSQHQEFGLETDGQDNVYFAGNFTQSMDFDPGINLVTLTTFNGGDNGFILKLDAQGNYAWAKQFTGAGSSKLFGLEVDTDGSVYTTGGFNSTIDFDPGPTVYLLNAPIRSCFISKLDKDGNFIYAKKFEGEAFGQSLALDANKNLYVNGGFHGTVDFDPGAGIYNLAIGQLFTVKLNTSGNFVWAAGYICDPTNYFESIYSGIKVDIRNNVYITGSFPVTVDFDPNAPVYNVTPSGFWDMYLHKLSQCKSALNIITTTTCSDYVLNGITYTATGIYYQTMNGLTGCDSVIELHLTVTKKMSTLDINTCNAYVWDGQTLSTTGTYSDTFHLANGCDSIAQINLTITKIITQQNINACNSFIWKGVPVTSSGIYKDTIHLASGCDSVIVLNLMVNPIPSLTLGKDTTLCVGETIILSPGNFNQYLWSDNTSAATLPVNTTGTYWVKVTDVNQCSASDTIVIAPSAICTLFGIPNAFTPNGDGINDYFKPTIGFPVQEYQFEIFNKWGEKIFVTNEVNNGWDGRVKSVLQNTGGFVYIIHYKINGLPYLYKGNFILIH